MEVLYSVLFLPSYLQNRPKPFILFFLFITEHKLVLTWWRHRAHWAHNVLFAAVTRDSPIPFFTAQDKINSSQDLSENANIQMKMRISFHYLLSRNVWTVPGSLRATSPIRPPNHKGQGLWGSSAMAEPLSLFTHIFILRSVSCWSIIPCSVSSLAVYGWQLYLEYQVRRKHRGGLSSHPERTGKRRAPKSGFGFKVRHCTRPAMKTAISKANRELKHVRNELMDTGRLR